jgi:L-fucose isomerase
MMTTKPKIGLIRIGDPRLGHLLDNDPVYADPPKLLRALGLRVLCADQMFTTEDDARREASRLRRAGVEGLVLNAVWFLRSNAMAGAAQEAELPVALWSLPDEDGGSAVGFGVSHGALDEMGVDHEVIYAPWEQAQSRMLAWARAVHARASLRGSRYGQIGGRCLEMMTGDVDNNQVKRVFGIDYDHMEQWELIHRAQAVADKAARPLVKQWKKEYKSIQVSDDVLLRSAKVYLAGKAVGAERRWDAFGIKCQPEFLDNYLAPCLPMSLWNDEGLVAVCEGDQNAAITMMALRAISGQPIMFSDLSHVFFEEGIVRLLNCGMAPSCYAGGKAAVDLMPCPEVQATLDKKTGKHLCKGGACTGFVVTPGRGTLARFGRIKGEVVLHLTGGEIVEHAHDRKILFGYGGHWPFAYVRPDEPLERFTRNLRAHHLCLARGDWVQELTILARLLGVRVL